MSEIQYPKNHFFRDEINAQKKAINELYKIHHSNLESSRSEYIKAMTHFKKMAEHHKNSYEALKSISDEIEKLEAIIVQPFIP